MNFKPAQHAQGRQYFAAMDGLRGIFAVLVAIYHTFWFSNINASPFFNNGTVIIDLFFVFSGFLMYTLYGHRLHKPGMAGTFLKRRFARLYPIHIVMLGVFLLFALLRLFAHKVGLSQLSPGETLPFQAGSSDNTVNLFHNIFMTHAMGVADSLSYNPPSWTISVEFFTYFVFLLMFLRMPPRKAWHFGVIALGIAVIYAGLSRVKPDMNITYDYGFWRCLAGFYLGVLVSWSYEKLSYTERFKPENLSVAVMTVLEGVTLVMFLAFIAYMPGKLQFWVAPFAFIFVLAYAFDRGLFSRFFGKPVFLYLAKISYSVYMIHAIVAIVFNMALRKVAPGLTEGPGWGGDLLLIPYILIVIGLAHLSWRFIEVPGQALLMKIDYSQAFSKIRGKSASEA